MCNNVISKGVCKLECPFLDVTASIFLHLHGLNYISCQFLCALYEKRLIYMSIIQFIVIQN